MDRAEHREKLLKYIEENNISKGGSDNFLKNLDDALYAFSETGLFGEISIDHETAFKVFALVETVYQKGFPEELSM